MACFLTMFIIGFLNKIMPQKEKKILIVEDEHSSAESLSIGLKRFGYLSQVAHSGEEGLQRLRESMFDFVLCDINMPEMDGWEFAKKAKQGTGAGFIFITADSRTVMREEFSEDPLLIKPIDLNGLLKLLHDGE